MENIKLKYKSTFESPIRFCRLGEYHPDNYYMNKCTLLFDNLFDKEFYKIEKIEGGGGGGQGCGYVWNAYKYIEDFIEKEIVITVTHTGNEVDIEIDYHKSNLSQKFIESIEEKIKDRFLNDQTVYIQKIYADIKDFDVIKIFNYFNNSNYRFCNTENEFCMFSTTYINNYQINNYDIKIQIILSEYVIYIYIDGFNNNLNKIGFEIEDFENYIKNI
jgi:hypothetical protein